MMALLKSTASCVAVLALCIVTSSIGQESAVIVDSSDCAGLTFVSRQQWGGRQPRGRPQKLARAVAMSFIHHTATGGCASMAECSRLVRAIQNHHMDKQGWSDIGYSFLIGGDGRVYVGRGWDVVGAHTYGYNYVALGFSLIGNFMKTLPTQAAISATQKVLRCGQAKGFIVRKYELFGHRDGVCTDCPGNALYNLIRKWPSYSTRKIKKYCPHKNQELAINFPKLK